LMIPWLKLAVSMEPLINQAIQLRARNDTGFEA